jgi:hypothetical protein
VLHRDEAPPSHGFDHLRIEQYRQRHPAGFGRRASGLAPRRLYPVAEVGHQSRQILPKAIGLIPWGTPFSPE